MIIIAFDIDLPRINVIASISITPDSTYISRVSLSPPNKYLRLSLMGAIQGCIFSSSVPGKNPISLPTDCIGRDITTLSYFLLSGSKTCWSAAEIARSVFPVPALPTRVTNLTSSSFKISSENFCSLFLGERPHEFLISGIKDTMSPSSKYLTIADPCPVSLSFRTINWLG